MPLLGGALKFASAKTPAVPAFTSDPYNVTVFELWPGGPTAVAGILILADGRIERVRSSFSNDTIGRWDGGSMALTKSDYQFRLDTISGNIDDGETTDTWLTAAETSHYFAVVQAGLGTETFAGTLRVRLAVSPFTEYDTASVSLSAERTP